MSRWRVEPRTFQVEGDHMGIQPFFFFLILLHLFFLLLGM
jgi:hypothetical protein